ncbi:histidine kinase N-terminal 7TM domain-containing protein [Vannielia litorea]|uniref:histidine kinase n=1 Tax=Vannielia litorea TaxID=1217970 RepID=A0A1N6GHA3_9RHOB|nr:histidine kinase N-terminal 7TM domain-containing protein [Vannielia litorea]SIO06920.1 Signal transduction histidine kinase [Vannielia litorea]
MRQCFEGVLADPVLYGAAGICVLAAAVLIWMLRTQRFNGKAFFSLTFIGIIWTLLCVGLEAASTSFSCQVLWATMAWPGNALVPVAWCFFVLAYLDNPAWLGTWKARAILFAVPAASFALAATNPWHGLVYTDGSVIPEGREHIDFMHGPGFYTIIASLYSFVMAAMIGLARAFLRARRAAWPMLTMLALITLTPLTANASYVVLGFTVFGLDPTAFMFTLGILGFSWLLATNKTMDMVAVGQSILFDTMSEPVIFIDRQGDITLMNTAARRSELHTGSGRLVSGVLDMIRQIDSAPEALHLEIGDRVFEPRVQQVESPLDPSGPVLGWSVTFIDITDRLAINAALQAALEKADEASRAKDEFISVVSHEMRTPLTSLKGGLALALSGHLGDVGDKARPPLEIAHRNAARLARLVDNILLAQKLEIEALVLEDDRVDLGKLLAESFEENAMFAVERSVRLVNSCAGHHAVIRGDAFAIRQIVDNLVSNAIKFSNEHGIVEGRLHFSDQRVRLSIKDSGRGIPEGMEAMVFGRFAQVAGSGQRSTQGSGLGLHISNQLAKRMSGNLSYESKMGAGTTFHVEFGRADEERGEPARLAG